MMTANTEKNTQEETQQNFEMKILSIEECNKDVEEKNKKSCHWKYVLAFFILIAVIAGSVIGVFLGTAATACESGYYGSPNCQGKIKNISKL